MSMKNHQRGAWLWIVLPALLLLAGSCCPCRNLTTDTERHDSVRIETNTVITYVPDTVYIEIPPQTAERTTQDSTSHLENDYATSEARLLPDGSLYHTLNTKPQRKPVQIEKKIERRDSIAKSDHSDTQTVEKMVEVTPQWAWYAVGYAALATVVCVFLFRRRR